MTTETAFLYLESRPSQRLTNIICYIKGYGILACLIFL